MHRAELPLELKVYTSKHVASPVCNSWLSAWGPERLLPTSIKIAFFITLLLAFGHNADAEGTAKYRATVLSSIPSHAIGNGIDGDAVVGEDKGSTPVGVERAILWTTPTGPFVSLHPSGFRTSEANDVYGSTQVGRGSTTQHSNALMWQGTAASVINLHPQGFIDSTANAVTETTQAGAGRISVNGPYHALLWHGTAESVVDLHVNTYSATYIWDAVGEGQVGWGTFGSPNSPSSYHALLWHGTAESVVDLHPAGYITTIADGGGEGVQVGYGIKEATPTVAHALMWQGTAASVVDLHPNGFENSGAYAAAGIWQVGYGSLPAGGGGRALVWTGSAESVIDLHAILVEQTGLEFIDSLAVDVDRWGNVVGWGDTASRRYAFRWTPVPEPSAVVLAVVALLAVANLRVQVGKPPLSQQGRIRRELLAP